MNSAVGMLLAFALPPEVELDAQLVEIRQDPLDLGGELSIPGFTLLKPKRVATLDGCVQSLNATLPRLREFVRPGRTIPAAQAHVCRTICRRAERSVFALAEVQAVSHTAGQYLNWRSGLMFVLAPALNQRAGQAEPMWNRERTA